MKLGARHLFFLLLSACAAKHIVRDAGPDAARPSAPVSAGEKQCLLAGLVDRTAAGETLIECGDLQLGDPASAFAKARACASNAIQQSQAFRLIWSEQGTDSRVRLALLGSHTEQGFSLAYYQWDSNGFFPMSARAVWSTCGKVRFVSCNPGENICVACEQREPVGCSCVVEPDAGATAAITCG